MAKSSKENVPILERLEERLLATGVPDLTEAFSQQQVGEGLTAESVSAGGSMAVSSQGSGEYLLTFSTVVGDDHGNTLQSPTQISLTASGSRGLISRINYAQDVDIFEIVATRTGRMRVRQSSLEGDGGLSCRLVAFDGRGIFLREGVAQSTGVVALDMDVVQGGKYYLSVVGTGSNSGAYFLNILPTLSTNFTSAYGVNVAATGSFYLGGYLGAAGETKMYRFTTPARGWLSIAMNAIGAGIDPYLQIFDSDGRELGRNDDVSESDPNSRIQLFAYPGRTLYVQSSGANQTTGVYSLVFTSIPIDDHGNTFDAASAISLSTMGARWIPGRIDYAQDVDMFQIVPTRTGKMTVEMLGSGWGDELNSELLVFDHAGELLVRSSDTGAEVSVTFDAVSGGSYYVAAAGADSTTGVYLVGIVTEVDFVPIPGDEIDMRLIDAPEGLRLYIMGTDGDDAITLWGSQNQVTLTTEAGSQSVTGSFAQIIVYGFGGADTIRATHTVTASTLIYGGEGDDMVFDAGGVPGALYGEGGDDLLVSIGGGSDELSGDDGLDSFWSDSSDAITDASTSETAARSIHRIAEFYQPYSGDPWNPSYIPLEIASQNFADPLLTGYASGYYNFASMPVFVDGAQYDDVAQGSVGDCYYLAALASVADTDPYLIEQMVAPLGDGTYAVRFYRGGCEVYLRIDADLPVSYGTNLAYAKFGPDGELWVPLVEKAYAYFRYGQNSYASIHGGWMGPVYREVTNASAQYYWVAGSSEALLDYLASALAEGHPVTLGSYSNAPTPVVGSHAYMVKSVEITEGGGFVTVYNPWGMDGRYWDANFYDGLLTISLDQVRQCFSAAVVSFA